MNKEYINKIADLQKLLLSYKHHPDLSQDDRIYLQHVSLELAAAYSILNKLNLEKEYA